MSFVIIQISYELMPFNKMCCSLTKTGDKKIYPRLASGCANFGLSQITQELAFFKNFQFGPFVPDFGAYKHTDKLYIILLLDKIIGGDIQELILMPFPVQTLSQALVSHAGLVISSK